MPSKYSLNPKRYRFFCASPQFIGFSHQHADTVSGKALEWWQILSNIIVENAKYQREWVACVRERGGGGRRRKVENGHDYYIEQTDLVCNPSNLRYIAKYTIWTCACVCVWAKQPSQTRYECDSVCEKLFNKQRSKCETCAMYVHVCYIYTKVIQLYVGFVWNHLSRARVCVWWTRNWRVISFNFKMNVAYFSNIALKPTLVGTSKFIKVFPLIRVNVCVMLKPTHS